MNLDLLAGKRCTRGGSRLRTSLVAAGLLAAAVALLPAVSGAADAASPSLDDMDLEQLMDLKVDTVYGASLYVQTTGEAPSSVTIITAEQIRRFGWRTLAEILGAVRSFSLTDDRVYTYLGVRGLQRPGDYNSRVLVLLDGHPTNENLYGSAAFGRDAIVDVALINRVEIIRGPGSSLYGTGAFFGVVNIITRSGKDIDAAEVQAGAGSLETYEGRLSFGRRFDNGVDLVLSGSRYGSAGESRYHLAAFDDPATNDGIAADADGEHAGSLFLRLSRGALTLEGAFSDRDRTSPTAPYGTVFNTDRTRSEDTRGYLELRYDGRIAGRADLTARAFYDTYRFRGNYLYDYAAEGEEPLLTVNRDEADGTWLGVESHAVIVAGIHTLTGGATLTRHLLQDQKNFDVEPFASYLEDERDSWNWGGFLQEQLRLGEEVSVTLGARYDWYETFTGTIANLRDIIGRVDESFLLIERVAADLAGLSQAVADGARREAEVVGTLGDTTASLSAATDQVAGETQVLKQTAEMNLSSLLELTRSVEVVARDAEGFAGSAESTASGIHEMTASLTQADERVAGLSRVMQETSAAMTEIDRAVGEVKHLSSRTRQVADGLYTLAAEEGGGAMARAVEGMAGIRNLVAALGETVRSVGQRSEEIDAIVAIVADIADSTNLLALNASILAAQAGEQGRGFAVVAGEIRSLSGRTDESIKRIAAHIASIQGESRRAVEAMTRGVAVVERGAEQVAGVGRVLERVVAGAQETSELNAQIAGRADHQAAESARVAGALIDLSRMAEQLLRSSGEQKETSKQILGIADETGHKAQLMKRSTENQLATVTLLQREAQGTADIGERLLEGASSSRTAIGAVLDSMRVIETAIQENRARAQSLREATDRLVEQSSDIRSRLAGFRLRA